jgi:hypothetical protein
MGSSVPWSSGRRERLAYRDLLGPAAAAVCTLRTGLMQQHARAYMSSQASLFDPAEARPAFLDGTRLPRRRSKLRPDGWSRPQRTKRRSRAIDC